MKKWLPLLLVLLFAAGAIAVLLLLPEQTQGPAAPMAGVAPPVVQPSGQGPAILPREAGDDVVAPAPDGDDADSGSEADDQPEDRNILDSDSYPTPFAKPDQDNSAPSDPQDPRTNGN